MLSQYPLTNVSNFVCLKKYLQFYNILFKAFWKQKQSKKEKVGIELEFFPWGRPLRPKWSRVKLKSHTHTSIDTHVHTLCE